MSREDKIKELENRIETLEEVVLRLLVMPYLENEAKKLEDRLNKLEKSI